MCKTELEYFTECKADPVGYAKFVELETNVQSKSPHYFPHIKARNFV